MINVRPAACMLLAKLLPGSGLSSPQKLWPGQPCVSETQVPETPLTLSVIAAASYRFSSFCLLFSWMRSARLCLPPTKEKLLKTRYLHCAEHRGFAFITAPCLKPC